MKQMTYMALVGASLIVVPLPAMGAEDVLLGSGTTSRIGDGQTGERPGVATTPSPGGPVPIPYPNIGSARTPNGQADVAAEPNDTQTDSVVPELGGVVVLCNNQSDDQNACKPEDGSNSDSADSVRFGDGIRGARTGSENADAEARRIPVHNPEWTNSNESDPGVTNAQSNQVGTEEEIQGAERRIPQTLRHRDR